MPICTLCGSIINKEDVETHIHSTIPDKGQEIKPITEEKLNTIENDIFDLKQKG